MRERGEGTLITVSSTGGRVAVPGYGVYCATKHAVEGLCDALRTEVAPFGVDVVLVEPGFTRTDYYETAERTLSAVAGPESPYGGLYEHLETLAHVGPRLFGSEPEAAAGVIADAAEADDPAARYPVGTDARLILLSRLLPDRVRDHLDRLVYGW
jgi:NAD(P)-dependent dehydrogenase (short-subunit alcohol dehydrogenase family)